MKAQELLFQLQDKGFSEQINPDDSCGDDYRRPHSRYS